MPLSPPRVFGIGFHKTGTTSLAEALDQLGYRVCHGAGPVRQTLGDRTMMRLLQTQTIAPILDVARRFDAFADNPWFLLYASLDVAFPGSRFILTVRDEDQWMRSVRNHFGRSETPFRQWIYGAGSPVGNEALYRARYRAHNHAVRAYFQSRPDDLLVTDWERGDGWETLCGFLGHDVPQQPFPNANRGRYPTFTRRVRARLRTALQRVFAKRR